MLLRTIALALILSPLCLFAFGEAALADPTENVPVNFRCITAMPTTSFLTSTSGDEVRLTVIHHNGVKYAPIHRGIVVPADFPLLQKKSEVMQKLGDRFEMVFEKKNCKTYGKKLYSCSQGKVIADGVTGATSADMLTRTASERVYDITFEKSQVSAGFRVDNYYYEFENDFYYEDCKFE